MENQPAISAKNSDRISNMVECFAVGLHMSVQILTGLFLIGHIKGHRSGTAREREGQDTHRPAFLIDGQRASFIDIGALIDRPAHLLGRFFVEHQLAFQHMVKIGRFNSIKIGLVGPLQLAHAGHAPGGKWRFSQHFQKRRRIRGDHLSGFFQAATRCTFLNTARCGIRNPNYGTRACSASISIQMRFTRTDDFKRKGCPVLS